MEFIGKVKVLKVSLGVFTSFLWRNLILLNREEETLPGKGGKGMWRAGSHPESVTVSWNRRPGACRLFSILNGYCLEGWVRGAGFPRAGPGDCRRSDAAGLRDQATAYFRQG